MYRTLALTVLNENYFLFIPIKSVFTAFGCLFWLWMWNFCIRDHVHWPV